MSRRWARWGRSLGRLLALTVLCGVALQAYFLLRVVLMLWIDPASTSFQRSEAWRLLTETGRIAWRQEWRPYDQIALPLKRAVIASEDAGFTEHSGVEWDALEKAWERNQKAEARAERLNEQLEKRAASLPPRPAARQSAAPPPPPPKVTPKIVGGSTITQQLAKNLFLGPERSLARKGQEVVVTFMLEAVLDKRRILELYLNHVEWGEGVFGAEAAAQHYFRVNAQQLGPYQAARLAVMLPAPKRFERRPGSAYVQGRASTIVARMGAVEAP